MNLHAGIIARDDRLCELRRRRDASEDEAETARAALSLHQRRRNRVKEVVRRFCDVDLRQRSTHVVHIQLLLTFKAKAMLWKIPRQSFEGVFDGIFCRRHGQSRQGVHPFEDYSVDALELRLERARIYVRGQGQTTKLNDDSPRGQPRTDRRMAPLQQDRQAVERSWLSQSK